MTDLDLSRRKLGEFVLREQIGAGGYGTVYRAEQPALQREAVVKVLRPRWSNDPAPERFLREAQLASRLDHPYAAHVYSFGAEDDDDGLRLRWIAMELVHGLTLAEWLRSRGPMPLARFVPFFECVAQVVQAAHARGIVHRDLKPSNIMVLESGGQLFPKLLDFGVAKLLEDPEPSDDEAREDDDTLAHADPVATMRIRPAAPPECTRTGPYRGSGRLTPEGAMVGSVPYMSPEQWHDPGNVGPATDLYSLGCVAYEALTGRPPFTAETPGGYYQLHLRAEPPPLGDRLPPGVDQALCRALAKSPDARHTSALELAAELRAVLRAEPREQLRVSAQQWHDRGRPATLLWHGDLLAALEQCMQRSARTGALAELELEFVDASKDRTLAELQAHERRAKWVRRATGAATAALLVFFAFQILAAWRAQQAQLETQRAQLETKLAQQRERDAQRLANATATVAELEQGRAALLHDEMEDAQRHLSAAWQRGNHSSTTAFMFARALQPRLAELAKFSAVSRRMWWTAWRPDGQQIVTTGDGGVQVWDAHSYQLLFQMPSDSVYSAVYSPDSARLMTAGLDGVYVWNAATGSLVRELRRPAQRLRVQLVAVSPGGTLVAVVDVTGAVTDVWNVDDGAQVAEVHNHAADRPSLAFSADGRWLATSGGDRVQILDTTNWQAVAIPVQRVMSLSFDPTGPQIAMATAGGGASVWTLPSRSLKRSLREVGEPIDQIAWSPDGRLIATASRDGAELVWNARSGALVSQGNHLHDRVSSIEFDPTSKLVLAAGKRVIVSDADQGIALASLDGPQRVARFGPNERRILGASLDGTARVWDSSSPYRRWSSAPIADTCGVFSGAEPDQRYLPIACSGHPTRIWDTAHDRLLAELPSVSALDGDFALVFPVVSSDGTRAAIARGNAVDVYELPGGRLIRTIAHGAAVSALAFGPGGDLVSGDVSGAALLNRNSSDQLTLPPARGGLDALAVLVDGRVVAADVAKHLRVIDRTQGLVVDLEMSERVGLLRPSPDAHRLVVVPSSTIPSRIGAIAPAQLWDLEARRFVTNLSGHLGRTVSARWISAHEILTAGSDGTARSWDGVTGEQRRLYRGGARLLADAVRSDELIVGGDLDGMLHFWDAASGVELWRLRGHQHYVAGIHIEASDLITRDFGGGVSRWSLPPASKVTEDAARRGIGIP